MYQEKILYPKVILHKNNSFKVLIVVTHRSRIHLLNRSQCAVMAASLWFVNFLEAQNSLGQRKVNLCWVVLNLVLFFFGDVSWMEYHAMKQGGPICTHHVLSWYVKFFLRRGKPSRQLQIVNFTGHKLIAVSNSFVLKQGIKALKSH